MTGLNATVWPRSAELNSEGALTIAGHAASDLIAEFGSPLFVLDEADFRSRCRDLRTAFTGASVYYAGKAFLCTTVARWVMAEGLGLDVCTGGELGVAQRAGFPPDRVTFHGNNKSVEELERAVAFGVGHIAVDSDEEISRLSAAAASAGRRQRVYLRVTPGVEAHTHEFISTGHEDTKFGFSIASGAALAGVRAILAERSLELDGVHCHIGSQIFDTEGFAVATHRMVEFLAAIRDEHGLQLPELNLGGGFGIAYTSDDDPLAVAEMAERMRTIVAKECASAGLDVPHLAVEPGRAIAGPSTVTLYTVGTVKRLPGVRTYVSVDGGMSDNIRTSLYDATYTAALASRSSSAEDAIVTVCGKHCESGDIVVRDVALPSDIAAGDVIAVPASGAYHRSMASNYNHVPRPAVVAVDDARARVIVRRETEDDLFALDVND